MRHSSVTQQETVRIGVAQIRLRDDFKKNIDNIISHINLGAIFGIDVLCFPESCIMSYVEILEEGLNIQIDVPKIHEAVQSIHEVAQNKNIDVIIGTPYLENSMVYNAALTLRTDGKQFRYYKNKLTSKEVNLFTPGNAPLVFELRGFTCGILVCRDQNYPALAREYRDAGVQIIFLLAAHYYPPDEARLKVDKNRALPIARALENAAYVFKANAVGKKRDYISLGGSIIVNPNGYVLAEANQRTETTKYYDIFK